MIKYILILILIINFIFVIYDNNNCNCEENIEKYQIKGFDKQSSEDLQFIIDNFDNNVYFSFMSIESDKDKNLLLQLCKLNKDKNPNFGKKEKEQIKKYSYDMKQLKKKENSIKLIQTINENTKNTKNIKEQDITTWYNKLNLKQRINFWNKTPLKGVVTMKLDTPYTFKMISNNDDTVVKEMYWSSMKGWERNEIDIVKKLLEKNKYDLMFDIGSYTGFYSLLFARYNQNTKIYTFEIIQDIKKRLEENIKINNFKNINTFNIGLSDVEKDIYINKGSFDNGFSSVSKLTDTKNNNKIKCTSLDNFIKNHKINLKNKKIFIKVDVEGHEMSVLKGMENLIKSNTIDLLFETESKNIPYLKQKFTKHNFKFISNRNCLIYTN